MLIELNAGTWTRRLDSIRHQDVGIALPEEGSSGVRSLKSTSVFPESAEIDRNEYEGSELTELLIGRSSLSSGVNEGLSLLKIAIQPSEIQIIHVDVEVGVGDSCKLERELELGFAGND